MSKYSKVDCIVFAQNCYISDEVKSHQLGVLAYMLMEHANKEIDIEDAMELAKKIMLAIFPAFFAAETEE